MCDKEADKARKCVIKEADEYGNNCRDKYDEERVHEGDTRLRPDDVLEFAANVLQIRDERFHKRSILKRPFGRLQGQAYQKESFRQRKRKTAHLGRFSHLYASS